MSEAQIKSTIKEFQVFRQKYTATCNAIRLDEVAQFVLYKTGKATLVSDSSSGGKTE